MTLQETAEVMKWHKIVGGWRKAGSTHMKGLCMHDGERAAHSHYWWAASEFWAIFGDMHGT